MNSTESKMSVWELMLLTAVNMIGAGIILLPASLAQVGGISIFSWIITTFCATCLAYAFAKCGMYSRKPGGMGVMRNIPLGRLEISCAAIPIRYRFWYRMWPLRFRLWAMELRALIFHWVRFPPVFILSGLSGLPRYPISEGQALPGVLVELPSLGC